MRIHMNKANLKRLGLYEILLGTYFDQWIPVLGVPKGCPAPKQFRFFVFDPPTEHPTDPTLSLKSLKSRAKPLSTANVHN